MNLWKKRGGAPRRVLWVSLIILSSPGGYSLFPVPLPISHPISSPSCLTIRISTIPLCSTLRNWAKMYFEIQHKVLPTLQVVFQILESLLHHLKMCVNFHFLVSTTTICQNQKKTLCILMFILQTSRLPLLTDNDKWSHWLLLADVNKKHCKVLVSCSEFRQRDMELYGTAYKLMDLRGV